VLRWLQQRLDDIHKPGKLPRELILGDVLRFELIEPFNGVIKPSAIQINPEWVDLAKRKWLERAVPEQWQYYAVCHRY